MKDNFPACLALVLKYEGGYVNDLRDLGGATMQGVTQKVYDDFRQRNGRPKTPVRGILPVERDAIYRNLYWDAIGADALPAGVDLLAFDIAVNSGPGRVLEWLRATTGLGQVARIKTLDSKRRGFWRALKIFSVFGRGWMARENDVFAAAMKMAAN